MVINDKGIIYQGKVNEVNAAIQALETLNLDMSRAKEELERIESKIKREVEKNYESFTKSSTQTLLHSSLEANYSSSTKELENLRQRLQTEWEEYYIVSNECNDISTKLQSANENNIKQIVEEALHVLNLIRTSTTIDFKVEKKMVDQVYKIIYQAMKLELLYTNNSEIYNAVKNDETDTAYIVDLIKKEIQSVDNEELSNLVTSLQKQGMDATNLLNKRLVSLLAIIDQPTLISESVEKFMTDTEELLKNKSSIISLEDSIKKQMTDITTLKNDSKQLSIKIAKKRLIALLNAIVVSIGISAGVLLTKHFAKVNEYYTITTTYDSSTDETTVEEGYENEKNGKLTIVEYSPWDSPGYLRKDEYTRTRYDYRIDSEDYNLYPDVKDYLDSKMQGRFYARETTERSTEKPEDYGYKENKYIIRRTEKDSERVIKTESPLLFAIFSALTAAGIISADIYLLKKLSKEKLKVVRSSKKNTKEEIKMLQEEMEGIELDLKRLREKRTSMEQIVQADYELLPIAVRESEPVAKQYKKI